MEILRKPEEMTAWSKRAAREGKTIGFVPTMGALHEGHMSLIRRARKENDVVVVSIFVNPTQFGPGEDYDRYPRCFEKDAKMCEAERVDAVFHPAAEDMYPEDHRTFVEVCELSNRLCGISRPGHFRGVTTVVAKLFGIVRPDRAYFGMKDAQQLVIIERMNRDLCMGVQIVRCETVREPDGLAMSSRNTYLSAAERKQALAISRALKECEARFDAGERKTMPLLKVMGDILAREPDIEVDYIAVADPITLDDISTIENEALAAIAVYIGKTRLIDNVTLRPKKG
ncbi:MAG: pantoate--beta-alanine ligase [Planctomycetota bacterium]|nr:pantoate--beta-alanine ligase [Planctomycetota bacterium]